jgi:excisionase family DNA binding protein
MSPKTAEEKFSIKEAAKKIGISPSGVRNLINTGKIGYYQSGTRKILGDGHIHQYVSAIERQKNNKPIH